MLMSEKQRCLLSKIFDHKVVTFLSELKYWPKTRSLGYLGQWTENQLCPVPWGGHSTKPHTPQGVERSALIWVAS